MVVFASLFIAEKILSNLRHQGEQGESRPEFSPLGGEQFGESSISGVKKLGEPNTLVVDGEPPKLILLWNEYQMIGKKIYDNIFRRITDGKCLVSNCRFDGSSFYFSHLTSNSIVRFTTDRSLQNSSAAIIFHMPNLHWENYTYPTYR